MSTEMMTRPISKSLAMETRGLKRADGVGSIVPISRNEARQIRPYREPVKGGSLAVAEKAGSLANTRDFTQEIDVESSVVKSKIEPLGSTETRTPALNQNTQGFNQSTINDLLSNKNQINGIGNQVLNQQPAIGNLAPVQSTGFSPIRNEDSQKNITTFVPGGALNLDQARYTQPDGVQQTTAPENNLTQAPEIQGIKQALEGSEPKSREQIITNQNEALKALDSGQSLEQAISAIAPAEEKTGRTVGSLAAEAISKIPGLTTQRIWQEAAKGGGFFKALKADWDQSFGRGKKTEIGQATPEINFLANRQTIVEGTSSLTPQTRSEISYTENPNSEAVVNSAVASEQLKAGNPEQIRESQQVSYAMQILQSTNLSDKVKLEMVLNLLKDLPPPLDSTAETSPQIDGSIEETPLNEVNSQIAESQPQEEQLQLSPDRPIAGLLPAGKELSPEENLNLPRTQADTIGNLSKKYDQVWQQYSDPKDREFHKAVDQKVQDLQQYIGPKELYKALNLNFDSSLTPQQEQARFESLLLRTVLQGSIDNEGNLASINSAKQKTDILIPGKDDLKTIFETGVRNFTTLEQAKNVKALTARNFEQKYGGDEQYSDLAFGDAFVEQLFSDPKAAYGVSPQMAQVLTSNEYQLNLNGKALTLNDILSFQRQNGIQTLMANQELIRAIAKAVKKTLELPQNE